MRVSSHAALIPEELEEVLEWLHMSFDSILLVQRGKEKLIMAGFF